MIRSSSFEKLRASSAACLTADTPYKICGHDLREQLVRMIRTRIS
jgi:hypothetical protein